MENYIDLLKAGTKIVLTKLEMKKGKFSMLGVGGIRSGTLSSDCKLDTPIYYREWSGHHVTSIVFRVFQEEGDLRIETETSIDSVRIVTDDNDEEFRRFLLR